MSELMLLTGLLFVGWGSRGCKGTEQRAPLDNTVLNAGLDPHNPQVLALVPSSEPHGVRQVLIHC
jgi:hypothetical protein